MPSGIGRPAMPRGLWVLMFSIGALYAQDPFEIHVLEYEQLQPGEFTFENNANYVGRGATLSTGGVFHDTNELTAGIVDGFSWGVMQLGGRRPDGSLEFAGWRLVPHFYVPRKLHLPLDLGFTVEFSFERTAWNRDSRSVTILPILEKRYGRIQLDLNPTFDRSLGGPHAGRAWGVGLAGRIGFAATTRFTPSLEYYGDWGPLPGLQPVKEQSHQILPGGDIRFAKNLIWSLGVGFGLTPATNGIVVKSRLEISFGGWRRH